MSGVIYLKSHGLRIVPVYEGLKPIKFLVVAKGRTIDFNSLGEAESFIMNGRKIDKGPTVDAIAELPTL